MTVLPGLTSASGNEESFVLNQENEEEVEEEEEVSYKFQYLFMYRNCFFLFLDRYLLNLKINHTLSLIFLNLE